MSYKVIDAPPLPFLPVGYPVLSFRLAGTLSYNDLLYLNRKEVTSLIRESRLGGRTAAALWLQKQRLPVIVKREPGRGGVNYLRAREPVFTRPLFCFAEVWRKRSAKDPAKGDRTRDIYNLCVKGFIDGCTDAGLWADDSEEHHRDFWAHYAGVAELGYAVLRFYEIEREGDNEVKS